MVDDVWEKGGMVGLIRGDWLLLLLNFEACSYYSIPFNLGGIVTAKGTILLYMCVHWLLHLCAYFFLPFCDHV